MNWGYSFMFLWLNLCRISTEILSISKSGHSNTHILTESYKIQPETGTQRKVVITVIKVKFVKVHSFD